MPRGQGVPRAHLLLAPAAFLILFFAYPMLAVARKVTPDAVAWLARPYVTEALQGAAVQGLLSVALTLAIAVPLAWMHHARRIPFGRLHLALHAAPFVLPVFVVVYGLQATIGDEGWLARAGGPDVLGSAGALGAVVIAHALYNHGMAARLLHAALERRPHRLEDAARTLGASPRAAFLLTTGRLMLPSLVAVGLLVFLFTFGSFGVVLFLGGGSVETAETILYRQASGGFPLRDRAAAIGLVQLLIQAGLLGAYALLHRRAVRIPAEPQRAPPRASPGWQVVAWLAAGTVILPAVAILVGGFQIAGEWSLEPWRSLADPDNPEHPYGFDLAHAVARSLLYAGGAALLASGLTFLLHHGARAEGPARRLASVLAGAPLAASSLLLGLGFLLAFGPGDVLDLRGKAWAIVVLHTLVAFPFAARILLPELDRRDHLMEDAARTLGASPLSTFLRVELPLVRAPLAAAVGLAAAVSLGDFGASVLVMQRPDAMGLAVWAGRTGSSFDPFARAQALALTGLVAMMAALALGLAERTLPRRLPA